MMCIWSHRPRFLHLALFFAAYVLGGAFATALAIVPGTNISIWPPGGLFIATLILSSPYSWPWWILVGCPAELLGQLLWWHSPLPAGVLMYVGNALEAAAGAWMVNRSFRRTVRLETLQEVLAFVVLAAGISPIISATVGSATLVWFGIKSQSFWAAWPLWWMGDATGILIVAPLALVVFQHWRGEAQLSAARWIEACVLGLIFLGVATLSLSGYLPFAYIIMPPLLWAAVRFEFRGAAVTLTLLALITAIFTMSGASQFSGDPDSQREKQIMLHLFLAVSAFSALVVAAISRQHQQALLTLRQSERSLRELVETLPAHTWCTAPDGEPIYFSQQFRDFIGFNVEDKDVDGASRLSSVLNAIIYPDDLGTVNTLFAHSLATGESYALKHRQRRFDGQYRWVETRAAAMRNSDDAIVQWNVICLDIDGEVRSQEELEQAQAALAHVSRVATLGEMSASIAHEVNQPLTAAVTSVSACVRWLDAQKLEEARRSASRAIAEVHRASEIIGRIRALAKKAPAQKDWLDVNETIQEVFALARSEIQRNGVAFETQLSEQVPLILADRIQLQQVILNLMMNAIEAMSGLSNGPRELLVRSGADGSEHAVISVQDSGPGIASENLDHLFKAFYTTKPQGMGMGLAISRSIIEAHGGRLWATANAPRGAVFQFVLPVGSDNVTRWSRTN
jgi:PAS domain S-box-containing protein